MELYNIFIWSNKVDYYYIKKIIIIVVVTIIIITVYTRVQVKFFGRENGLKKSTSTYIWEK